MRVAPSPVENRVVSVGGHSLHVRVEGEGEPLLLLSGLRQSLERWDPFVASLGERRVVRFDAPGVGRTATPTLPESIGSLAQIAEAVLDAVEVDRADVVGFSFGGAVAQQLAHSSPTRVRRLVLVATTCGLGSVPGRWSWKDAPTLPAGVSSASTALALLWQTLAIASWSSVPFLGSLRQPTLVVCGLDDAVAPPANGRILAARIPGARLVNIDADHGVLEPGPATELAHVVEGFLRHTDDVAAAEPERVPARASSFSENF